MKVIKFRHVAILEIDLQPCADVFVFTVNGGVFEICGKVFEIGEDLGEFKKGILILKKTPFSVECEEGRCLAAKL